jgi:hypothetical protein
MPWFSCLEDCTPDCLDTVIGEFVGCLLEPDNDCFNKCNEYQGTQDSITIPLLTPNKNCDLQSLLEDWHNCLPTFPACDAVQETIIPFTCNVTACCSVCHDKKVALESCFYNWISGHNCTFTCSDRRSLTRKTPRKLAGDSQEPEFVEECWIKFTSDLMLNPDAAFNDYMDCIMSNSMELAADESNRPVTQKTENTTSGGASGRLMTTFPISVATLVLDLMW